MEQVRKSVVMVICVVWILAACSRSTVGIEVKDPWARPAEAGANSAVYFEIENGGQDDMLLSVSSRIAERTEIHRTFIQEDGTAKMEHQSSVEIPGGDIVIFAPGGLHIMLTNLDKQVVVGDTFDLTLKFENEGEVIIHVTVQTP